jgi:hypothetical protein
MHCKLYCTEVLVPVSLVRTDKVSQGIFQNVIGIFSLTIRLGVIPGGHVEVHRLNRAFGGKWELQCCC